MVRIIASAFQSTGLQHPFYNARAINSTSASFGHNLSTMLDIVPFPALTRHGPPTRPGEIPQHYGVRSSTAEPFEAIPCGCRSKRDGEVADHDA
jgi:hypothetical protein